MGIESHQKPPTGRSYIPTVPGRTAGDLRGKANGSRLGQGEKTVRRMTPPGEARRDRGIDSARVTGETLPTICQTLHRKSINDLPGRRQCVYICLECHILPFAPPFPPPPEAVLRLNLPRQSLGHGMGSASPVCGSNQG